MVTTMTSDFRLPHEPTCDTPSRDSVKPEASAETEIIEIRDDPSISVTTEAAQQIWERAYQEPWPERWRVGWMIDEERFGACVYEPKLILLGWNRHQDCADEDEL